MTDPYTRPRTSALTPLLAGAALVTAGYLVLDRTGVFEPPPQGEPRSVQARGNLMSFEETTIKIFEENKPSVVHITLMSRAGRFSAPMGSGSGFVWDDQGHIVTNYHVVEAGGRIAVRFADRREFTAELVHADPSHDIAVLRFQQKPQNLRPVLIGSSHDLRVGQSVFALGNPFGLQLTYTTGVVSALNRSITPHGRVEPLHNLIQTDAAINPGNSGGPLFDSAGRLIGMNSAIVSKSGGSTGLGFAVPIDTINKIVPDLIERRLPPRAIMGVYLHPSSLRLASGTAPGHSYAVAVKEIIPGFGAQAAGLRPVRVDGRGQVVDGDAILAIDGQAVEGSSEVMSVLKKYLPGMAIQAELIRFERNREPRVETVSIELRGSTE